MEFTQDFDSSKVGIIYPKPNGAILLNKLQSYGLLQRCVILEAETGGDNYKAFLKKIHSATCASDESNLAAASILQAMEKIAEGELESAVAIVKDPEDSAEKFGSDIYIALATQYLLNERPELGIEKLLIVGLDVHCGNIILDPSEDPRILNFSVYRHKESAVCCGNNINVSLNDSSCGDADYYAVWDNVLIPVAEEFNPDMVIILAGFDTAAAFGPTGGCPVTPYGYSVMLKKLMDSTRAKFVIAFDQGHNFDSLLEPVLACTTVLVEASNALPENPSENTWTEIQMVCQELCQYWPTVSDTLSNILETQNNMQSKGKSIDVADEHILLPSSVNLLDEQETLTQSSTMNLLTVNRLAMRNNQNFVWYASYGLNMSKRRFISYIRGEKVQHMNRRFQGFRNKNVPKASKWRIVPHRLFFGLESTITWGRGGIAFLDYQSHAKRAHVRIYKITLEQFNDALKQENNSFQFDLGDLFNIRKNRLLTVGPLKGWYNTVLYLGEEGGLPVMTFTCSPSELKRFKSKQYPLKPPSKAYKDVLVRGLQEVENNHKLSKKGAENYIEQSCNQPLFEGYI